MAKNLIPFINIALLTFGAGNLNCTHHSAKQRQMQYSTTKDALERDEVLKIAKEIAEKKYGNIIKKEMPLKARLIRDSIWVIEGTLKKGADGGTVYIELRKGDHELLKITHYK
ncbi:NTF2 fold immunity protein [Compostibacter hankyongensis]|uniref:NTF2 fold domain-containing protein n=1 Tax=Compostibacter hankyongensis TaxID=1007089 RepID=A0ABP8FZP9_9BACT